MDMEPLFAEDCEEEQVDMLPVEPDNEDTMPIWSFSPADIEPARDHYFRVSEAILCSGKNC